MVDCPKLRSRVLVLAALAFGAAVASGAPPLQYNRDIRPILAENCFACHGPDSAARQAELRLDQREAAVESDAIVPGKPKQSSLVTRVLSADAEEVMPPPKTKKKLTDIEKELLQRWIAEGAEYEPHWSLIAPTRPEPPTVKNAAWVRNPIDSFVLAKLEAAGLSPAQEADRRTLARRLSLDLIGLPPDPQLVEDFVGDDSARAYEALVERLLQSQHWGEHRGRHWLDVARYADTHGIHFDNYREIWAYRDWVIGALNRNMPFDRFVVEQLAGDLLPGATLDQKIATGFCRCNITTNEGGIIDEEYKVLYARDRTETFGQIFLGLTAGCAVCHDHKFDPLTMKDFYSLSAFFDNTTQPVRDGNIKDTPPVLVVPTREDRPRWDALQSQTALLRKKIDGRKNEARPEFDKWLAGATAKDLEKYIPTAALRLLAGLNEGQGKSVSIVVDGLEREITRDEPLKWAPGPADSQKVLSLQTEPAIEIPEAGDFEAEQGLSVSIWVKPGRRNQTGAIVARMDNGNDYRGWDLWLEGDKVGMHVIHKWPDDALKVVAQTPLTPNEWTHVCVTYDGTKKGGGIRVYYNGKLQPTSIKTDALKGSIRTAVPFKIGQRNTDQKLRFMTVSDLRLFSRGLSLQEASQLALGDQIEQVVAKAAAERTDAEKSKALDWWLMTVDDTSREFDERLKALQEEETKIKSRGTLAHVMHERDREPTAFVLFRGEYDQRRDAVTAAVPKVLPELPAGAPNNRLGLAQWLLQPDHPLTARVTVNRFWQEVFGTGLVKTSGDFGTTGEPPSHPELLDWLAVEFRESGWDIKRFFTLLVTSSAYRQAAVVTPEKLVKDADNRLLSRGPRYRLDAEMIRDYALAASGLLVPKIGGPSVKPYQPEGVWEAVAMIGSNTRNYQRDSGENLYRRSMYTFWKRAAPPASMEILNAPNRETACVRRERTDTPLQALVTLNDEQFVEAARCLAERALGARSQGTGDRRQGTGDRSQESGVRSQETGVRSQETGDRGQEAGVRSQESGVRSQESGVSGQEAEALGFDFLARRLLARPFTAKELPIVKSSLRDLLAYYRANPEDAKKLIAVGESKADTALDPAELAAWTMLANELMNLDEVLNK